MQRLNNVVGTVQEGYEKLVHAVIRPPRATYTEAELGPQRFLFAGRLHHRIDFDVFSLRPGNSPPLLKCSHWTPEPKEDQELPPRPCVIFLHGNASCRLEGGGVLHTVLSSSVDLVALDFGGSGMSHGEYVTLGHFEKDDLLAVINHLRKYNMVSSIGLWGRSMGAVTALLYAQRDPTIAAMVLDSPFSEFRALAGELCEKETYGAVPEWLADAALAVIKVSIQKRAGFDVDALNLLKHAPYMHVPALFAAATDDDFIYPYHSRILEEAYGGNSSMLFLEGDHNSERSPEFAKEVKRFFMRYLFRKDNEVKSSNHIGTWRPKVPRPSADPVPARSEPQRSKGGYNEASSYNEENDFVPIPQPAMSPRADPDHVHEGADGSRRRSPKGQGSQGRVAPPNTENSMAALGKGTFKTQLLALGFSGHLVDSAMKRNSTLESCVEWMVQNPDGA